MFSLENNSMTQELYTFEKLIQKQFEFLNDWSFSTESSIYKRMDAPGGSFPDLPSVKVAFVNKEANREVEIELYSNYYPIIYLRNSDDKRSLRFSDYLEKKHDSEIGVHTMNGSNVEEKLINYFKFIASEFRTPEILDVLTGKTWIDIPLDWGPYK